MRKFQSFAFAGAIALAGVAGLTACSSDDAAEAPLNPTFDGESVKAAFAISLPTTVGGGTRMSADETQSQQTPVFKGMKNIYMFPFALASDKDVDGTTDFRLNVINLQEFDSFTNTENNTNKKIYSNQTFAVGTSDFLFYGETKINQPTGCLKPSYLNNNGSFQSDNVTKAEDITFSLNTVCDNSKFTTGQTAVLTALNAVYTKLNASTEVAVKDLVTMLTNKDGGGNYKPFAGSARSILALVEDLYNSLVSLNQQTLLADVVVDANSASSSQDAYFTYTQSNGVYTLAWKKNSITFPQDANLPDGAVAFVFDSSNNKFTGATLSTENPSMELTNKDVYVQPAALYYFVNTNVMEDDQTHFENPTGTPYSSYAWTNVTGSGTDYKEAAVNPYTRSVILKDPVQYGVGLLESKVKAVENSVTLKDSKANVISISDTKTFKVTGILIGNQKNVNWNFTPTTASGATVYTVWDGNPASASAKVSTSADSDPNYTLLLETAENENVNVCLELENNCEDFYGKDGKLIPYGTKFYLVGTLTVPTTGSIKQVFKQDYKTTATFKFGENTLSKAYNVIPDLRTPKLEFGLSVDLTWKTGLTFDVNL